MYATGLATERESVAVPQLVVQHSGTGFVLLAQLLMRLCCFAATCSSFQLLQWTHLTAYFFTTLKLNLIYLVIFIFFYHLNLARRWITHFSVVWKTHYTHLFLLFPDCRCLHREVIVWFQSVCWLAGYLKIWWTHLNEICWEHIRQGRTHKFFLMQIVPLLFMN